MTCAAAIAHRRPVAVCGDAAADPALVPVLIGLGVRELSVPAPRIAEVKDAVRALRVADWRGRAERALLEADAAAVRAFVAGAA